MDLHPSWDHLRKSSQSLYAQSGDVGSGRNIVDRAKGKDDQTEVTESSESL